MNHKIESVKTRGFSYDTNITSKFAREFTEGRIDASEYYFKCEEYLDTSIGTLLWDLLLSDIFNLLTLRKKRNVSSVAI